MERVNLLGFDVAALTTYVESLGEKPFRARQLARWIHRRGAGNFDAMTDLAKSLRGKLEQQARDRSACRRARFHLGRRDPQVAARRRRRQRDRDRLHPGGGSRHAVRVVAGRLRGQLRVLFDRAPGLQRNLSTAEIVGQLWLAEHALRRARGNDADGDRVISNVVLMGMGEPLQNYEALVPALRLMLDDHAYGLSRRRVTVSTSGMVPQIDRLAPIARSRSRCRCMRRPMSCATDWCRSTASTRCAN